VIDGIGGQQVVSVVECAHGRVPVTGRQALHRVWQADDAESRKRGRIEKRGNRYAPAEE